jgi:hypothetical protein
MFGAKDFRCGGCLTEPAFINGVIDFFKNSPDTKEWYEPVPPGKPNVVSNPHKR